MFCLKRGDVFLKPLISIIIPCHNSSKYIAPCIQSILKQTYANFEIICIDDHSTDCTYSILNQFGRMHQNFQFFQLMTENWGPGAARNMGLSIAQGDFIVFVDSDDIIAHNMLEDFYSLYENYQVPIITGDSFCLRSDQNLPNTLPSLTNYQFSFIDYEEKPGLIYTHHKPVWGKLYKREAIQIQFLENCIWEDIDFTIRVSFDAKNKLILEPKKRQAAYYYYRDNQRGICHSLEQINERSLDGLKILNSLWNYFQNKIHLDAKFQNLFEELTQIVYDINLGPIISSHFLSERDKQTVYHFLYNIYCYYYPYITHEYENIPFDPIEDIEAYKNLYFKELEQIRNRKK